MYKYTCTHGDFNASDPDNIRTLSRFLILIIVKRDKT